MITYFKFLTLPVNLFHINHNSCLYISHFLHFLLHISHFFHFLFTYFTLFTLPVHKFHITHTSCLHISHYSHFHMCHTFHMPHTSCLHVTHASHFLFTCVTLPIYTSGLVFTKGIKLKLSQKSASLQLFILNMS